MPTFPVSIASYMWGNGKPQNSTSKAVKGI